MKYELLKVRISAKDKNRADRDADIETHTQRRRLRDAVTGTQIQNTYKDVYRKTQTHQKRLLITFHNEIGFCLQLKRAISRKKSFLIIPLNSFFSWFERNISNFQLRFFFHSKIASIRFTFSVPNLTLSFSISLY